MRWTAAAAAVAVCVGLAVVPAAAIDVQGTYEGTMKCTTYLPDQPAQTGGPEIVHHR